MWSCGVIPSVSPTVPTAEAVSYRHEESGRFSYTLIKIAPPKNNARYIVTTVAAVLTTPHSILRPKNWTLSCWRKVAAAFAINTASVVVFIPPAVEPGDPPIIIRKIITACDAPVISERITVLKPAVLGVTDWKKEASTRFPMGSEEKSTKKKNMAGRTRRNAVVTRITLLCIR